MGSQRIVMAVVPADRQDAATAEVYCQQAIEIVPGLKILQKSTGKIFEVLSRPAGVTRMVSVKDFRRNLTPEMISEDELRRNFRFVT